jgi:hypothetical protein
LIDVIDPKNIRRSLPNFKAAGATGKSIYLALLVSPLGRKSDPEAAVRLCAGGRALGFGSAN